MSERLRGSEASRLSRRVAGRTRVVVERVRPEVDGGRFPIKRTVGESVEVHASIHADGHDTLAAAAPYLDQAARLTARSLPPLNH